MQTLLFLFTDQDGKEHICQVKSSLTDARDSVDLLH